MGNSERPTARKRFIVGLLITDHACVVKHVASLEMLKCCSPTYPNMRNKVLVSCS